MFKSFHQILNSVFQLRSIIRNQTGIEDWIIEKANYRRREAKTVFENPYDLVSFSVAFLISSFDAFFLQVIVIIYSKMVIKEKQYAEAYL